MEAIRYPMQMLASYAYLMPKPGVLARRSQNKFYELIGEMMKVMPIFIDSGAYTVSFTGHEIDLKAYMDYCRICDRAGAWNYIQLDKIGDRKITERNLKIMRDAGLKPMPVLTYDMPAEKAAELSKVCDGWMCCGGQPGNNTPDKVLWHRYIMAKKHGGANANIHALSFLRFPDIFRLPIASVDAATWSVGQRFGVFKMYDRKIGLIATVCSEMRKAGSAAANKRILEYFAKCGITTKEIVNGSFNHGGKAFSSMATVQAYFEYTKHCTDMGMIMWMVVTSAERVFMLASVNAAASQGIFHYKEAVRIKEHLLDLSKRDWPKCVDETVKLVRGGLR